MSTSHHSQHFHRFHQPFNLLIYPRLIQLWVTDEGAKVAAFGDHAHPHPAGVHLHPLDVTRGDGQDALGRIREVAPQMSPHHNFLHMILESLKIPFQSGIICVPWLRDLGVRGAELTDEWEDIYAIGNHREGPPLGHALIAMQELAVPVHVAHQHIVPVVIAVEGIPRTDRPIISVRLFLLKCFARQ